MKKFSIIVACFISAFTLFGQHCYNYFEGAAFSDAGSYQKTSCIIADKQGNLWMNLKKANNAFDNGGLLKLSSGVFTSFTSGNSNLPSNLVHAIAADSEGNIWAATENGLAVFNGTDATGWTIYSTTSGLPVNKVTAVAVDKNDTAWAGFESGKLYKVKGASISFVGEVAGQEVNVIFTDPEGNIWLGLKAVDGTKNGLAVYNGTAITQLEIKESIVAMGINSNGEIYASGLTGVYKVKNMNVTKAATFTSIYALAVDSANRVWVSSNAILYCIEKNSIREFTVDNSGIPSQGLVQSRMVISNNTLWLPYYKSSKAALASVNVIGEKPVVIEADQTAFCSGSYASITAKAGYNSYLWNTGATTANLLTSIEGTFHIVAKTANNCFDYDTIEVIKQTPFDAEKLCLVTVDNETGKNLLVWERTGTKGTASYNVYKETDKAGEYKLLANLPFNQLSVYTDDESVPGTRSERYKISVIDTCGNESALSTAHKTMHLTINVGIEGRFNLIWENYEGTDFQSYEVYRGPSEDNLEKITTVPSNITTYTDDPPAGTWYYQIAMVLPGYCSPANLQKAGAGPYSQAVSNMERKLRSDESAVKSLNASMLKIYATPGRKSLNIISEKTFNNVTIEVLNINGQIVLLKQLGELQGNTEITMPAANNGLYLVRVSGNNIKASKKVIIE